jgi:hypothetical protein
LSVSLCVFVRIAVDTLFYFYKTESVKELSFDVI